MKRFDQPGVHPGVCVLRASRIFSSRLALKGSLACSAKQMPWGLSLRRYDEILYFVFQVFPEFYLRLSMMRGASIFRSRSFHAVQHIWLVGWREKHLISKRFFPWSLDSASLCFKIQLSLQAYWLYWLCVGSESLIWLFLEGLSFVPLQPYIDVAGSWFFQ